MKHLKLDIDCGEKTCAKEPGTCCRYVYTQRFGTEFICHLFSEPKQTCKGFVRLEEEDGWLMRHPECLKCEKM